MNDEDIIDLFFDRKESAIFVPSWLSLEYNNKTLMLFGRRKNPDSCNKWRFSNV